jgi:uncharacterized tellurite resistance protein B-like protein
MALDRTERRAAISRPGYAAPMSKRAPNFARIIPLPDASSVMSYRDDEAGALRDDEKDAVIELAFLMANADGTAASDELASVRALVKYVRPDAQTSALLGELAKRLESADSIEARARAAVAHLKRRVVRELAYKAVYTIAVFDLETNDDENELGGVLVDLLGLGEVVDDLEREVNEALVE